MREMPMRLAITVASKSTVFGLFAFLAAQAFAAEGDRWVVDRKDVNIRSGPSTSTDVLMTVNPGERIVEIATKGDWYFAELPDRGARGWIYGPLLVKPSAAATARADAPVAAAAPNPVPAAAPAEPEIETAPVAAQQAPSATLPAETDISEAATGATTQEAVTVSLDQEPAAVKSFRETVSDLNSRAVSVAGINLFDDVRSTGGGGVQVLATETWASVPEAGQTSYMNALFDRWNAVASGLGPLSLQIIDPSGAIMMER